MDLESKVKFLIEKRKKELENKFTKICLKALNAKAERYCVEGVFMCDIGNKADIIYQKVNEMCDKILDITIIPNEKSEAVIAAILINMFEEKKAIDDLVSRVKKHCLFASANINLLEIVSSDILSSNFSTEEFLRAESILETLIDEVVSINAIAPHISKNCFDFFIIIEKTFAKIKMVLERL